MFRLEGAAKQSLSKLCLVINRMQQEKKFIDKYHIVLACKYGMFFFNYHAFFDPNLRSHYLKKKNMKKFHKGVGGESTRFYTTFIQKTETNQYK